LLVYCIPFLPLYISKSIYFPYIAGKNFLFRTIIELASALWLVLIWSEKRYRLRNSIITFSILVFTLIVGLADILGVNPYNSFWSNYERMEGYITILHLLLYFCILKSVLKTRNDWTVFLNLCFAAGTLAAMYAIAMPLVNAPRYAMEYGTRIAGTLGNPPFLASYLLLIISIGLLLIVRIEGGKIKILYIMAVFLNMSAIYLTSSRGAILAVLIGLVFLSVYNLLKRNNNKDRLLKAAYIFLFIIIGLLTIILNSSKIISNDRTIARFASSFSDTAIETRFEAWKMALEGIKRKPFLGWGQENFISLYTIVPIPFTEGHSWVDRAHNILIDWLVNAGILGLISYLAILGSAVTALIRGIKNRIIHEDEAVVIIIAIIVYFIHNLFTFDTINTYIIFFALLAYIDNTISTDDAVQSADNRLPRKRSIIYAFAIFCSLLAFISIAYYVNYKPIRQSQITKQSSFIPSEDKEFAQLLNAFNKALSYNTFSDTYVRLQMASVANGIYARQLFDHKEALLFLQSSAEELYKGIPRNRGNLTYLSAVIAFYQKIAVYDPSFIEKTEALINACLRLNPQYDRLYMMLSDLYILKKDYEEAFHAIEHAIVTSSQNDTLQIKLALAAILTNREEIASMAVQKAKDMRLSQNTQRSNEMPVFSADELYSFARAYKEVKDYGKALKYYKELQNASTINADLRYEIAETYRLSGDSISAEKEQEAAKALASENMNNTSIK